MSVRILRICHYIIRDWRGLAELLILVKGNAKARLWDKQGCFSHVFFYIHTQSINLNAKIGRISRRVKNKKNMNIDDDLKQLLKEINNEPQYSFESKIKFEKAEDNNEYSSYCVDLTIRKNNNIIMVISSVQNDIDEDKTLYQLWTYCPKSYYYVVLKNDNFYCKEKPYSKEATKDSTNKFSFSNIPPYDSTEKKTLNINGIIDLIKNSDNYHFITLNEVQDYIKKCADTHSINLSYIIENIKDENFGYNNHEIWLDRTTEMQLIKTLLNDKEIPSSIYRYTSAETLTRIFNNEEVLHSMSSLITMNDTTEMDYTDNYLKKAGVDISENEFRNRKNNSVHAYITSLTNLKDDLTLWRLYGDNAKGVCIGYEVPNHIESSGFILAWVSYADKNKKNNKLDFITELMKQSVKGRHFILREWYGWKHFLKPYEYNIENEIRLLTYVDDIDFKIDNNKRKWITTSDNIFAPLLLLPLKPKDKEMIYPLQIKNIMLGSKFKEKEANKITWEYKITDEYSEYVASNFHISISEIDNYR